MKTRLVTDAEGTTYLTFWCPGCDQHHGPIVARGATARPLWIWNGDRERPTLSPSIRVRGTRTPTDAECERILAGEGLELPATVCHSVVRDGQIEFLSDCTHALAGRTVPLPDMEDQ